MCEAALSVVTRMLKPRKKKEKTKELGEEVVSSSFSPALFLSLLPSPSLSPLSFPPSLPPSLPLSLPLPLSPLLVQRGPLLLQTSLLMAGRLSVLQSHLKSARSYPASRSLTLSLTHHDSEGP